MNRALVRQQRVNALWASFSEFCRILASCDHNCRNTDSGRSDFRFSLIQPRLRLEAGVGIGPASSDFVVFLRNLLALGNQTLPTRTPPELR
jgi:hypothetical protein